MLFWLCLTNIESENLRRAGLSKRQLKPSFRECVRICVKWNLRVKTGFRMKASSFLNSFCLIETNSGSSCSFHESNLAGGLERRIWFMLSPSRLPLTLNWPRPLRSQLTTDVSWSTYLHWYICYRVSTLTSESSSYQVWQYHLYLFSIFALDLLFLLCSCFHFDQSLPSRWFMHCHTKSKKLNLPSDVVVVVVTEEEHSEASSTFSTPSITWESVSIPSPFFPNKLPCTWHLRWCP